MQKISTVKTKGKKILLHPYCTKFAFDYSYRQSSTAETQSG